MFIVVTSVEGRQAGGDVRDAAPGTIGELNKRVGSAAEAALRPGMTKDSFTSRHERMVSGADMEVLMDVRVELDVYRFKGE